MRIFLSLAVLASLAAGCVHGKGGGVREPLSSDFPSASEILTDLEVRRDAVQSLESIAIITLKVPGEEARQSFRTGLIQYEAPDRFFLKGRKLDFIVRLYVEAERFLLELPSENTFYYGRQGERFPEATLDVAPSRLIRELLFLDVPGSEAVKQVTVADYDEVDNTATLAVRSPGRKGRLIRQITVEKATSWRVIGMTLLDDGGAVLAETVCDGYLDKGGVQVPSDVSATFPGQGAEMKYSLREQTTKINHEALKPPPFESLDRARVALSAEGYQEIRGIPQ